MSKYVIVQYSGVEPIRRYVQAWDKQHPDIAYRLTKDVRQAVYYQTEREAIAQRSRANGAAWDLDVLYDIEEIERSVGGM